MQLHLKVATLNDGHVVRAGDNVVFAQRAFTVQQIVKGHYGGAILIIETDSGPQYVRANECTRVTEVQLCFFCRTYVPLDSACTSTDQNSKCKNMTDYVLDAGERDQSARDHASDRGA